ncbi:MAG: signal recognition particle-docking protein FtsY [Candidatus Zixiibacteriota bacterium]|nr:MAG: signal recognition particle-docking protein FtsY [candidate division Zixibacteria bacterium]
MSLFGKLKEKLVKTQQAFGDSIRRVLSSHPRIDEDLYAELEEALLTADVGVQTAEDILQALRDKVRRASAMSDDNAANVRALLGEVIAEMMAPAARENGLNLSARPAVILVVGVNGSGKTTTIAKLARKFQQDGRRVLLAAGDTFRAAASEQLSMWGDRLGLPVISQGAGADPAAVAFDALQAAKARGVDLLIIDTAGRLHNKANLMQELSKIGRVLKKLDADAPHEVLLVLDANTGQNMVQQARVFQDISGVTGLVVAKLDGTAKGGAVISVCHELNLPVRFIGLGEKMDDLDEFDPEAFARVLLGEPEARA